jgi:sulfite reductase alpha subunit-like flavoprotein
VCTKLARAVCYVAMWSVLLFCTLQDLIPRHMPDVAPLLSHPKCHVYICGSNSMAQAAAKALEASVGPDQYAAMVEQTR